VTRLVSRAIAFCATCLLVACLAGSAAAATSATPTTPTPTTAPVAPIRIRSASLQQSTTQLVWSVRTIDQFSPNEMQNDGRSLCLLIERVRPGTVVGELCVRHPGSRRHPQLVYRHATRNGFGAGRVITATVTRADDSQLTATFLPSEIAVGYRTLRWQVLTSVRGQACAASTVETVNSFLCGSRFPALPALALMHTPRLVGCTASGAPFVNSGPTNRRVVALTFDDGPWYDTPQFLNVLERAHVVATFFEIGEQISTYGQGGAIERRMLADGDMVGDHTWSHPNVAGAGPFAASQISSTANAISAATGGFRPCLFRAPYGAVSGALISEARSMGFTTIQWNVDPTDWARPGTDAIYQRVVSAVTPGSIVIQHDGGGDRSETLAALPREIATLKARGYSFVTVTQLLGDQLIYR
jgi:peptidoglycan/xylan/chitin deacetylase (PgdA/CDA1 family)